MITLNELKIILNNSSISNEIKTNIIDNVGIFYEFLDFLAEKLGTTQEVADKFFQLNYKIKLIKMADTLKPNDDNYIDIVIDVMVE